MQIKREGWTKPRPPLSRVRLLKGYSDRLGLLLPAVFSPAVDPLLVLARLGVAVHLIIADVIAPDARSRPGVAAGVAVTLGAFGPAEAPGVGVGVAMAAARI